MTTIGIVSPGAMGSALGRSWAAGGARVVATLAGRSERTRRLAHGLELLPSLTEVVAASDDPGDRQAYLRMRNGRDYMRWLRDHHHKMLEAWEEYKADRDRSEGGDDER